MSVSDPSLRRLKQHVLNVRTADAEVTDSHPELEALCCTLEEILSKGLKAQATGAASFFVSPKDCYHWLFELPELCRRHQSAGGGSWSDPSIPGLSSASSSPVHPLYEAGVELATSERRVRTGVGRGRLLLRYLLHKRLIHWPVLCLLRSLNRATVFYDDLYSIVGNEILVEIFASLLQELAKARFALNLRNASFLDETFTLPRYQFYEFVPCQRLGLHLVCVHGHQVVEAVLAESVAAEDNKVEPGDILDEVLGHCVKNSNVSIRKLLKENRGWPVRAWFMKARQPDGAVYQPLVHMLKAAGHLQLLNHMRRQHQQERLALSGVGDFDDPAEVGRQLQASLPIHARLEEDCCEDTPAANPDMAPSYTVRHVGSVGVGSQGGVAMIEPGIERALRQFADPALYRPCRLELDEKEVVATALADQQELTRHAYPQISACGRRVDCVRFVAYIAGETTCTIARNFHCHVFEARSDYESKTILCSIAQGFERTHWAL